MFRVHVRLCVAFPVQPDCINMQLLHQHVAAPEQKQKPQSQAMDERACARKHKQRVWFLGRFLLHEQSLIGIIE